MNSRDGTLASTADIKPGYSVALYNSSQTDFVVKLPYSELHLTKGLYRLQYKLVLFDDKWNRIAGTRLYNFTFTQD